MKTIEALERIPTPEFGFLEAGQLAVIFSIHKNTWFNWVRRGHIGPGICLGRNKKGWAIEDVREFYRQVKEGEIQL